MNRILKHLQPSVRPVLEAAAAPFILDSGVAIDEEVVNLARIQRLSNRVEALEGRVEELESEREDLNQAIIKTAADVAGALMSVVQFAIENRQLLKDVHFGRADGQFRFILVGKSSCFDWDLSDKVAGLLTTLLKNYGGTPIGCQTLPASADAEDIKAILAQMIYRIKPEVLLDAKRD